MTLKPGRPYVTADLAKDASPRWHRLPSSRWLLLGVLLWSALLPMVGGELAWGLLGVAMLALFVASVATAIGALFEIAQYRRPVPSIVNLAVGLLLNPAVVMLVWMSVGHTFFGFQID